MKLINLLSILIVMNLCLGCNNNDTPQESGTNGAQILLFNNYLGNSQNIHPKVLYFNNGWNGWEFWMAYTPYPKGNTNAENPSLAVSHDGVNWTTPPGIENPIDKTPKNGYNSDTHLIYDEKNDCLEIWWRPFDNNTKHDAVRRSISMDGKNWSEQEIIVPFHWFNESVLSPTVWIENGKYYMVYSNGSRLKLSINPTIDNPEGWSHPVVLPVDWGNLKAWHHDIIKNENGDLEMVVCAFEPGCNNNSADLYYVKVSSDFQWATDPQLLLHRGENKSDFDYRSIYRSSLVKVDSKYYLYYSAISYNWKRSMALIKPSSFSFQQLITNNMQINKILNNL